MPNTIEVAVRESVTALGPPTYCTVVITNCNAKHVETEWLEVNGPVPARFADVPPGLYYIVVVPEGESTHLMRFVLMDGKPGVTPITLDLSTLPPVGRITAIVLVGGQRAPGKMVMLRGKDDDYVQLAMTNSNGVAAFDAVPETQVYDVVAYHATTSQEDTCDLVASGDCEKSFSFPVVPC